jgi:hypothetical protein
MNKKRKYKNLKDLNVDYITHSIKALEIADV